MQQVLSSHNRSYSPRSSVLLLPDVVQRVHSNTLIVSKQNDLLHEKYAVKLVEYKIGLKDINEEITGCIVSECLGYNDYLCKTSKSIEESLDLLKGSTEPNSFTQTWEFISETVKELFVHVNTLYDSLCEVERHRLDMIKCHTQNHYIAVKERCQSDDDKLNMFFNKDINIVNGASVKNYSIYTKTVFRLKLQLLEMFKKWHDLWELLLFGWKDNITKQNIEKIEKLSKDSYFLVPDEIERAKSHCLQTLDYGSDTIHQIMHQISTEMPVNIEIAVSTFSRIGKIISSNEDAILMLQEYSTKVFDERFRKILGHIEEMRGYLKNSCIYEQKSKSFEFFEYSVFSICTDLIEKMNVIEEEMVNEMDSKRLQIVGFCEEVKNYIFRIANLWGTYQQAYRQSYKEFIEQLDSNVKSHDNIAMWMERGLDKSCKIMVDCRTIKKLDRKLAKIKEQLDKIVGEYYRYRDSLDAAFKKYKKEWVVKEKGHENNIIIALDESLRGGFKHPEVLIFIKKCKAAVLPKVKKQMSINNKAIDTKVAERIKQTTSEVEIRVDLHSPRFEVIQQEVYGTRKNEIIDFRNNCDYFWDEVTCGERKYTILFNRLSQNITDLIDSKASELLKLEVQMTKCDSSESLMKLKGFVEEKEEDGRSKLNDLVDKFQIDIIGHRDYVKNKHLKLLKYSELKNLKFTYDQKIRNEYDEFEELAEDMRIKSESERQREEVIFDLGNKTLSHYCYTLFGLFYLERRTDLLNKCRLNIKTEAAVCQRETIALEKKVKSFIGQDLCSESCKGDELIVGFKEIYSLSRKATNHLNYSSGIGEQLAQCVSMEKLKRRYVKFGEGQSRSLDNVFLKEIVTSAKKIRHTGDTDYVMPTKDNINWKVHRGTIAAQFIGNRLAKIKFGVGASTEKPEVINPNFKAAVRRKMILQGGQPTATFWMNENVLKPEKHTAEEHNAIVAQACAKLRGRRQSALSSNWSNININSLLSRSKASSAANSSAANSSAANSEGSLPHISQHTSMVASSINTSLITTNSCEQMDMETTLSLIKTADFLTVISRSGSPHSVRTNHTQFDFLFVDDSIMKSIIFDTEEFFCLKKRSYCVETVLQQIASFPERVKFILRHSLEDCIIVSEIFFRQRNIRIIQTKSIPKDVDLACKSMEIDLQCYYDKVLKFCQEGIEKIKEQVNEINSYQETFITNVFKHHSTEFRETLASIFASYDEDMANFMQTLKQDQEKIMSQLNPHLCHPQHRQKVDFLEKSSEKICNMFVDNISDVYKKLTECFTSTHETCLEGIEDYKKSLYEIADITVHPIQVKRITRAKFKGIVHKDCLQDHYSGNHPRKFHKIFEGVEDDEECNDPDKQKQQTVFYDHIAAESARAIVSVNTFYDDTKEKADKLFTKNEKAVRMWKVYWKRNVDDLLGHDITSGVYF